MSIIDTSTWNPDPALNESIGDIPLNANASIQQTWQAIQMLMAAGGLHGLQLVTFDGATASADGTSGLVPAPEAGDQNKVLKGDGTWGAAAAASHTHGSITNDGKLGTASRAVVTDGNKAIAVSGVTATELGYLSGVTSAVQTQLDAKAADSGVVHSTGAETISGIKTLSNELVRVGVLVKNSDASKEITLLGGTSANSAAGAKLDLYGGSHATYPGGVRIQPGKPGGYKQLFLLPDGTATWDGQTIQTASDERLKTPLSSVPDEVLDAWEAVQWGQFQFLDAVESKGENARLHLGLIAQKVKSVFEARGLDACKYGILCHEEHPATGDGPAVDLWMVRYTEALAMETACLRRRIARLEEKLNG